jgi:hypothetical protein
MRMLACLVCMALIFLSPSRLNCQERGGSVRVRVSDERGTPQTDETPVYAESHALLIGNSVYADSVWSDLPDVDEDLEAVREVLERQHGFKVEVALNNNREALLRVIDLFITSHGQRTKNRLLIYYSGHGYTALLPDGRRMGYLVMPDAPAMPSEEKALRTPPTEEQFERFLPAVITMDDMEAYARRIAARHALFVFDSCFSGTALYKDLGVSVPGRITTEELKPVRAYLTAGNETQRVPAYSRFRRKLVEALSGAADTDGDGYILGSELGRWVSIEVEKETSRRQTPVFGKDERFSRGDMIFISPRGAAHAPPTAAALPTTPSRGAEQLFWQEIEKRNTVVGYQSYLSAYPKGEYARVAQLRAENLTWEGVKGLAQNMMKYDWVGEFSDDRAAVTLKGKIGYIDQAGREVIPPTYSNAGDFSEGLAWVWSDHKLGAIDQTGRYVIAPKYEHRDYTSATMFLEGVAFICSGLCGYVDRTGREMTEFKYTDGGLFSEGLAPVCLGDKWGFIDKSGKEVIRPIYEEVNGFSQGVAEVTLNGRQFYINKWGQKTTPPRPQRRPVDELVVMVLNDKFGVKSVLGSEIVPFVYDHAEEVTGGLILLRKNEKSGLVDKTGREVVPVKYDSIWCKAFLKEGFVGVKLGDRKGFADIHGNEYWDLSNLKPGEGATARPTPTLSTVDTALTGKSGASQARPAPVRVYVRPFVIELDACGTSGRDVVCRLTVENQSDEQREFGISHNNWQASKHVRRLGATQASDGLGKFYCLAESSIGSRRYTDSRSNLAVLAPRESAKLSLRFVQVPAGLTSFPSLMVTVAKRSNTGMLLTDAIFNNVPIAR